MDSSKFLNGLGAASRISAGVGTNDASRATSPGPDWPRASGADDEDDESKPRSRPRVFPYLRSLPYAVEDEAERLQVLDEIIKNLYIALETEDFNAGALHWTRELRAWLELKYDMPRPMRVKLVKLYYELTLVPGMEPSICERFAGLFMTLTKKKHYLRAGKDLYLDWRPLLAAMKPFVLPDEPGAVHHVSIKRSLRTLSKLATFAQLYFNPAEIPLLLEDLLPYFTTSSLENAHIVLNLLNLLLPTMPSIDSASLFPQSYLPAFFHIWSIVNRSRGFDYAFLDLLSRISRDHLASSDVPFSAYGVYTKEQVALVFAAVLRLLDLSISTGGSPYTAGVDVHSTMSLSLDRDQRKHPHTHNTSRWIIFSLSPACLEDPESILAKLEGLMQAIEDYYHPSNHGSSQKSLCQMLYYLADFFVMRWNREHSGEMDTPKERVLNPELKRRFVLCLREATFRGLYSKSTSAMNYALSALQSLAYLEPGLILPSALQRIYPSMQGLVEVHRTTSSLRMLQVLSKVFVQNKGFRCHVTTLLGLALPGIDANDLEKTVYTLNFLQAACHCMPFHDLTQGRDEITGSAVAMEWVTAEVANLEAEGGNADVDYENKLSDEDEAMILRSSTAGFGEFVISLLGRIFSLLENLPDASKLRVGSPEENVINALPAALTPLFASLSPELYDIALNKIADFVANHVIHQGRDAMAFICNSLCKVHPEKALRRFVPHLVQAIRTEIEENGAGVSRNVGSDILPRDRALCWNISMLSMMVVHVGDSLLEHKEPLLDIALYMQKRCKGIPAVHSSTFVHHLLLSLTCIYTIDFSLYEPEVISRGVQVEDIGKMPDASQLSVNWHVPSQAELEFAGELFVRQSKDALAQIWALTSDSSPIKPDGTGKEWSDEISKNLMLLKLMLAGVSFLFDVDAVSKTGEFKGVPDGDVKMEGADGDAEANEVAGSWTDDELLGERDDPDLKRLSNFSAGKTLDPNGPLSIEIHRQRQEIGEALHRLHCFMYEKHEDDVSCFAVLYATYRVWFVDVGLERSGHVLDRVSRQLSSDIHIYKLGGLHKDYPRPLLVRRAYVYHLQRLRNTASPRPMTALEETLFLDLAQSMVSVYTDIRRHAQVSSESAVKTIRCARNVVIRPLLKAFADAAKSNDYPRIKGCMYSLVYSSLSKNIGRDWRFAPSLIRSYLEVSTADKTSIQILTHASLYSIMELGRPVEQPVIMRKELVETIAPSELDNDHVTKKHAYMLARKSRMEERKKEFAYELLAVPSDEHWKTVSRRMTILIQVGLRFKWVAPDELVETITKGTVHSHPSLRGLYSGALVALLSFIDMRALCKHDYANYIKDTHSVPTKFSIKGPQGTPDFTTRYVESFAKPGTDQYFDHDDVGWLVWPSRVPAYRAHQEQGLSYDDLEHQARRRVGAVMTKEWVATFLGYLKQEPRDAGADRFRMASAMLLVYAMAVVLDGTAAVTLEELEQEIRTAYDDGSDKHQHRATAEILGALLIASNEQPTATKEKVWAFAFPMMRTILEDGLTPDNVSYWTTCVHMVLQGRDPRRSWPLVEWLANFQLDVSSNAAFKESSKIGLLHQCIVDTGWHFQLEKPIVKDFICHLNHPYKGVREAMGKTLATLFRTRYHESWQDVSELLEANRQHSSTGIRPYQATNFFKDLIHTVLDWLERNRLLRESGQQTPSSYTSGSKTFLLWIESSLSSYECVQLSPYFPDLMEPLLHMMDVKEDPELQSLAYMVFRHLANVPIPRGDERPFIEALIRIGKTSWSWHQRLRIMLNIQVIYFRRLFQMSREQQLSLFGAVCSMLEDTQIEVRLGASATLSGMIRCSPAALKQELIEDYRTRFTRQFRNTPVPPRPRPGASAGASTATSTGSAGTGTPTAEHNKIIITRHAAVLGLGALIQAFPYTSPPPTWMPALLAMISAKAAFEQGMVGKSVKSILGEFKKTRQDTWHVDVKAFTPEQLDDLEGVLWKSYFA